MYDGDWKDNKRCGFGTLSFRSKDKFRKVYSGGWKNDKRHVINVMACFPFKGNLYFCTNYYNYNRAMALTSTLTQNTMRGNGTEIKEVDGVECTMMMVLFMRVNGLMI